MKGKSVLDMSKSERDKVIQSAQQEEVGPNPQKDRYFQEQNWIQFKVEQQGKPIKLQTYRHKAVSDPVAIVIMFHGLGSHINHGGHIAHELGAKGITTYGFDYRGFGKSQGIRGYIHSFDLHIQDCMTFIGMVKQQLKRNKQQDLPLFFLGLSLGGLTSFLLSFKLKVDGIILMAPALKPAVGKFLVGLANVVGWMLPKFQTKKISQKPIANRNPTVSEFMKNDKYCVSDNIPAKTLQNLLNEMSESSNKFKELDTPFVLVMGGRDKLVDVEFAERLMKESRTKDKQFWFYEQMWHNVWHQQQIDEITERTTSWILARSKK